MFLPPDVLFRDEFTLHHSTPDLYIGLAPTNEPRFFSLLNAKTKTEGGTLRAIWSVNKNANSGEGFLSRDNGGVVTAAPKDGDLQNSTQPRIL